MGVESAGEGGHPFEGSAPPIGIPAGASSLKRGNPSEGSDVEVVFLERGDPLPDPGWDLLRAPPGEIDEDERLRGRDHEHVVALAVGGELVRMLVRPILATRQNTSISSSKTAGAKYSTTFARITNSSPSRRWSSSSPRRYSTRARSKYGM